MVKNSYSF